MITTILVLLKQYWKPIAIACVVLSIWGSIEFWGHEKYKDGYNEAIAKYNACEVAFKEEKEKWDAEVESQKKLFEEYKAQKEQVVERNWDVFKDTKKKVTGNKEKTDAKLKQSFKKDDTINVPGAFVVLYNSAVEGSYIATGNEAKVPISEYPSGIETESVTFGTAYFAEVIKGNVDKYNTLAQRCDKLVDIVVDLEGLNNGPKEYDSQGTNGTTLSN